MRFISKFMQDKIFQLCNLQVMCRDNDHILVLFVLTIKSVLSLFYDILTEVEWCLFQRYYTPTARELARLAQIQITPILHHFSESLAGAASIRAFDQEDRFTRTNLVLVDGFSKPWFHNVSAMEWLSFRLNLLSNFVFAFSLVLLVSLPEGFINPSKYN